MRIRAARQRRKLALSEDNLLPAEPNCPCCNSANRSLAGVLQAEPEVLFLQCETCTAISASRIPTAEALADYYRDFHDSGFSEHGQKITFDSPGRLADHIVRTATEHSNELRQSKEISILDFGGGDGTIGIEVARRLLQRTAEKVNLTVIDYGDSSASPGDDRISISRAPEVRPTDAGAYKLVVASAVIAHLPFPRQILPKLFQAIADSGVLYVRTPHFMPFVRLFRTFGVRLELAFPGQLPDMGPEFWRRIPELLTPDLSLEIVASQPSIVESSLRERFLSAAMAHIVKAPWRVLGDWYPYVGGWEVFYRRGESPKAGE